MPARPPRETLSRALAHHEAGRLQDAEALYREILTHDPRNADALHLLGVIGIQSGRPEIAVELIPQAIAVARNRAEFHSNLGEAFRRLARRDEAAASLRTALKLQPKFPAASNSLGLVLAAQHKWAEATDCFQRVLRLVPNDVGAHHNLGNLHYDTGEFQKAEASFRRVLAISPTQANSHYTLGNTLLATKRPEEAVAAYRQALALRPSFVDACNNLAVAYQECRRLDEALATSRQGLALKPDSAEAHNNLGGIFKDCGQLDEAVACYRQAIALQPDYVAAHSNLVLALHYQAGVEPATIEAELREWNRRHAAPLASATVPFVNDRSPGRRLRIGYVSPDFRDHAVGRNLLPLFEHHAHEDFEIFAYAHAARDDATGRRIRAACDHWRDVTYLTDAQLAAQVREDQVDILVDLAMHTAHHRLLAFAHKPAPVQASFAAYPGRSGLDAIDYHLTDKFLQPPKWRAPAGPDAPFHLSDSFWCYEGFARELPAVAGLPAAQTGRVTFGCLNAFCKFNRVSLQLFARVLLGVRESTLLLACPAGQTRDRALEQFRQAGVAADRIEFVGWQPWEEYLALYDRIDVGLDTFPYNGHTTSLDSYWMGVPVVTLVGTAPVSRAGLSQWSNLGSTDLVAKTPDDYVRIATKLAGNLPRLAELRAGLRERMKKSPLMAGTHFARQIEAAYRRMWRTWCETAGTR